MAYAKKMSPKHTNYNVKQTPMGQCVIDSCIEEDDGIDTECPSDPDLLLLRDAAADERNAIAFYLRAAHVTCLDGLFLDVAEDEMHHYVELMQMISSLDPIQAEMFEEVGLTILTTLQRLAKKAVKWMPPPEAEEDEAEVTPPSMDEMETVDILTKSINDELMAINKYQRYMEKAVHPEVKALFCHLMNEEKEHVAEFTKALWCITHEPLPPEHD